MNYARKEVRYVCIVSGLCANLGKLFNVSNLQFSYLLNVIVELSCWTNMSQESSFLLLHSCKHVEVVTISILNKPVQDLSILLSSPGPTVKPTQESWVTTRFFSALKLHDFTQGLSHNYMLTFASFCAN